MVIGPVHCMRLSVRALLCAFVLSNVAFWAKLRANRFLQGGKNLQLMNDGTDMTMSEDQVWKFQQLPSPSSCKLGSCSPNCVQDLLRQEIRFSLARLETCYGRAFTLN